MCCGGGEPWGLGFYRGFIVWIQSELGSIWFPSILHFCNFFFWFLFHTVYSLLAFFTNSASDKAQRSSPAQQRGDSLARKMLMEGEFPGYTTSSKAPPLYLLLLWTSLHCNMSSPLNDSSNNWSSFSCKHHVSLDKGTVNTIMVLISNSF